MQASLYMVFYTIVVSFPFLVGFMRRGESALNFLAGGSASSFWGLGYLSVFLVKLPVYGVHV